MLHDHALASLTQIADCADVHAGIPGHSKRVAFYTAGILRMLGISGTEAELIVAASQLHDIGKLGLPTQILTKPSQLDAEEWRVMRSHAQRGADFLAHSPALRQIGTLVLHHHERFDGAGYPHGLQGAAIPLGARIIAVADSFDAMISDRPFRKAMLVTTAMAILTQGAGTQWDRLVVATFLSRGMPRLAPPHGPDEPGGMLEGIAIDPSMLQDASDNAVA